MLDYIIFIYFIITFFGGLYTFLWSAAWVGENENSYKHPMKDIFAYPFIAQIKIYEKYDGILNTAGKVILVLIASLFLIPTNILLFITEIIIIACYFIWSLFLFLFKERKLK